MGILSRYLALLPPDAVERVLTGTDWTTSWHIDEDGARNLLGHAEDWSWPDHELAPLCGAPDVFRLRGAAGDELWSDEPKIGLAFGRIARRWGLQDAVEIIRARIRF